MARSFQAAPCAAVIAIALPDIDDVIELLDRNGELAACDAGDAEMLPQLLPPTLGELVTRYWA